MIVYEACSEIIETLTIKKKCYRVQHLNFTVSYMYVATMHRRIFSVIGPVDSRQRQSDYTRLR